MKIVAIGDVHGNNKWKTQVQEPADMYIFIGDYFDSWGVPGDEQISNFLEILEFRNENPDKVFLLAGNHDVSYMDGFCQCSGYQNDKAFEIKQIVNPLRKDGVLKACKIVEGHIFVHAGITRTWLKDHKKNIRESHLEEDINTLFKDNIYPFCFQATGHAYFDNTGDDIFQSPLWVRPHSLMMDAVDGYKQVVGHTRQKNVVYNKMHGLYFIDCQDKSDEFLILEL